MNIRGATRPPRPPRTGSRLAFADGQWQQAAGPFGKNNFPISDVNTPWDTPEIWLRRAFSLDRVPAGTLYLLIRHDEDATVYVNGQKVAEVPGNSSHYMPVDADKALRAALETGRQPDRHPLPSNQGGSVHRRRYHS